jgi:hypothetical protein
LIKVVIPEGIIELGYNAFEGCLSLDEVKMPSSVSSVWMNGGIRWVH